MGRIVHLCAAAFRRRSRARVVFLEGRFAGRLFYSRGVARMGSHAIMSYFVMFSVRQNIMFSPVGRTIQSFDFNSQRMVRSAVAFGSDASEVVFLRTCCF